MNQLSRGHWSSGGGDLIAKLARVCRGGRREGQDWPGIPGLRVAMCVDELDDFGSQLNLALVGCHQPGV